jgi:hypothetical protein
MTNPAKRAKYVTAIGEEMKKRDLAMFLIVLRWPVAGRFSALGDDLCLERRFRRRLGYDRAAGDNSSAPRLAPSTRRSGAASQVCKSRVMYAHIYRQNWAKSQ